MRSLQYLCLSIGLFLSLPVVLFADDLELRAIVEKAIERSGGETRLAKYKGATAKLKGTIQLNGSPVPFNGEMASQGMDKLHVSGTIMIDGQSIAFHSVLNGDRGWFKINDFVVDMTADQLTETQESAYSEWVETLLPLKDKAFKLAPFGEIEIAGRKAVGINVTREGHRSINLFFDKETSQLVRSDTVVHDEESSKDVTEETTFGEFKMFEQIQYPTKIIIKRNDQAYADIDVSDFKPSESLDDSNFSKP